MDKNEKIIMTVQTSKLLEKRYFQGFSPANKYNYENLINSNTEWMKRGIAEKDFTRKQPIAYCLVTNPLSNEIFVYQRGGGKNYSENKLSEKFSFGFGGHIEKVDATGNPIHNSLKRELEEEVDIPSDFDLSVLGYINDDENEVGKVHFGILYQAIVDSREISLNGLEASSGNLVHISKIEEMLKSKDVDIEPWSKISYLPSIPFIKQHRTTRMKEILKKKLSYSKNSVLGKQNKELIGFVKKNMEEIELKEKKVESVGVSFEPRLELKYEVMFKGNQIGKYKELRVYDKRGESFFAYGAFA